MGASENSGTPKSSILIRFSIINHPFWGTSIFGDTHMFLMWPWKNSLQFLFSSFESSSFEKPGPWYLEKNCHKISLVQLFQRKKSTQPAIYNPIHVFMNHQKSFRVSGTSGLWCNSWAFTCVTRVGFYIHQGQDGKILPGNGFSTTLPIGNTSSNGGVSIGMLGAKYLRVSWYCCIIIFRSISIIYRQVMDVSCVIMCHQHDFWFVFDFCFVDDLTDVWKSLKQGMRSEKCGGWEKKTMTQWFSETCAARGNMAIPSRERSHIPPREKGNHRLKIC